MLIPHNPPINSVSDTVFTGSTRQAFSISFFPPSNCSRATVFTQFVPAMLFLPLSPQYGEGRKEGTVDGSGSTLQRADGQGVTPTPQQTLSKLGSRVALQGKVDLAESAYDQVWGILLTAMAVPQFLHLQSPSDAALRCLQPTDQLHSARDSRATPRVLSGDVHVYATRQTVGKEK